MTHPPALDLVDRAVNAGWVARITPGISTGEDPYVTVDGANRETRAKFTVTWHTRKTGTYRLSGCMLQGETGGWRDTSLKAVKAAIEETP